jgi:hypothetical protein
MMIFCQDGPYAAPARRPSLPSSMGHMQSSLECIYVP